jgi:hypothetical protein
LPGRGKLNGVFNLLVQDFDGLVDVAGLLHGAIIGFEIGGSDLGIVCVEMCQDLKGGACSNANVREAKCGEIHGIDDFNDE